MSEGLLLAVFFKIHMVYIYIVSSYMINKQTHGNKAQRENNFPLKAHLKDILIHQQYLKTFPPKTTLQYQSSRGRSSSPQPYSSLILSHTTPHNNKDKQLFHDQIDDIQTKIKNMLRRMKYKDKLSHLEILVEEARSLTLRYGYFYVTGANFIFNPQNQIKLSLWIHPNRKTKHCMHPINQGTKAQNEKEFYKSFKMALKQLFPTVSMGQLNSYNSIRTHIQQLQQNLTKRLLKSVSSTVVLNSPRNSVKSERKILNISRLVDFNDGISVIEEDEEEGSTGQSQRKLHCVRSEKLLTYDHRTTTRTVSKQQDITISNIMKEDGREEKPKFNRNKISRKILLEFKQLLTS